MSSGREWAAGLTAVVVGDVFDALGAGGDGLERHLGRVAQDGAAVMRSVISIQSWANG